MYCSDDRLWLLYLKALAAFNVKYDGIFANLSRMKQISLVRNKELFFSNKSLSFLYCHIFVENYMIFQACAQCFLGKHPPFFFKLKSIIKLKTYTRTTWSAIEMFILWTLITFSPLICFKSGFNDCPNVNYDYQNLPKLSWHFTFYGGQLMMIQVLF